MAVLVTELITSLMIILPDKAKNYSYLSETSAAI